MKLSLGKELLSNEGWLRKAAQLRARFDSVHRLFHTKKYSHPDDLFFSYENLPIMGKEYWFLHFSVPGTKMQSVLTFGRAEGDVTVNRTPVKKHAGSYSLPGNAIKCAAVCWQYGRKKQVVIDSHANVVLDCSDEKSRLCAASGPKNKVCVEGKYPNYRVLLRKAGKAIFTAKVFSPKKGKPFEIINILRSPIARGFGAVMVNYYFEFDGVMEGKRVNGKAYLQKVVAVLPLAPWNWVRVQFANGAAGDFFMGKPLGNSGSEIHFACNDYLELNGERIRPEGHLSLESWFDGENRKWLLSGKNFYLAMETYALQPFVMRQKTVFRYDEYLVCVTDFRMKAGGKTYSLSDLGAASGIVEDASGYLI